MTELYRMAAACCHDGTVQLLVWTKILDHQVRFFTAIVFVFVRFHFCIFYLVLVLCPAVSSRSRFHNITQHNFRFLFHYENRSAVDRAIWRRVWVLDRRLCSGVVPVIPPWASKVRSAWGRLLYSSSVEFRTAQSRVVYCLLCILRT